MSATPIHPTAPRRRLRSTCAIACLALAASLQADDRFIVPVGPSGGSAPSSGGGSSGSSGGSASYSGGDSGSQTSSGSSSGHSSGGRFFVPMPGPPAGGGGGGDNGGGGGGGGGFFDPYWGGCYYMDGRYHYWNSYRPWEFGYPYSGYTTLIVRPPGRNMLEMRGPLVFFPPEPPPLGTPLPERPRFGPDRIEAPAALHEFLTAPFYPQLSGRLHRGNLSKRQLQAVDDYRAARRALLAELRATLAATRDLPAPARTQKLETFATSQQPKLDALAESAETLRTDLLRGGLISAMGSSGDWNQGRTWRLGSPGLGSMREQTLGLEFRVMRAAAFYQEGLSPAQRSLLREIAAELQADAYRPRGQPDTTTLENAMVFFSPATARLQFSSDLPAHIRDALSTYTQHREAIKAELRDVVYTRDNESRSARAAALRHLAAAQASRITSLELLAEEIRRDIAALGRPLRASPLGAPPADLAVRLASFRSKRGEVQRALDTELAQITTRVVASDAEADTLVREGLAAFMQARKPAYDALDQDRLALRADLVAHYSRGSRTVSGTSIDALINAADETQEPDALWHRYAEYADAVLLPGLSSGQRQLLFDAALEHLDLPLPDGERMP